VHAPTLTVKQVRDLHLPSTPLKETERRASRWRAAFGIEQTEIDALASLDPDTLEEIARQAIKPYFDDTLGVRIHEAGRVWRREAQAKVDAKAAADQDYAKLREDAVTDLNRAKKSLQALQHATTRLIRRRDLPSFNLPEAEPDEAGPEPLVSSDMDLEEHIEALRDRKCYSEE